MTLPEDWPAEHSDEPQDAETDYVGYADADDEPDFFARVMYYVLDFPGLSRVAKDAYICLVRCLGFGKRKRPVTREELAAVMSISTDTLDRGLKELASKDIIEIIRHRDPKSGNWKTSSYLLKDSKSARMRRQIVELQQALGKAKGSGEAKPQVEPAPQNAVPTDEGKPGGGGEAQSANCGLDSTSDDDPSPQVATSPQIAEPPVRNLRNRQSADCGHRREISSREREEKREEREDPPVPAVGGPTVRNARAPEAPAAQPSNRQLVQARGVLARLPRFRAGRVHGWVRRRHLTPMTVQALNRGFGADAIVRYALMTSNEGRYAEHQHIPEYREALRRLGRDVALGTVCPLEGLPLESCGCATPDAPCESSPDRPWTSEDQQQWERVLERFRDDRVVGGDLEPEEQP